jgi:HlyD family secretion protein
LVTALVAGAAAGRLASRSGASAAAQPAPTAPAETRVPVEVVRVRRTDLPLRAEATGYLEAWRRLEVKAEVSGRVVRRVFENGDRVRAGALLVQIDDRDDQIELEEARAEWLKIQAGYAVDFRTDEPGPAAADPKVADELGRALAESQRRYADGLISRRELEDVRRRYEAARILSGTERGEVRAATSGLAQAEQRLERARLTLERTRITAPFASRVADLSVEVGQTLAPGETLLTLLEDDRIKVDVDVLEADLVHLRPGAPARVRIPSLDGLLLEGSVHTINPKVEAGTGTGRVTVAIPNPRGLLLTGLFATVELETGRVQKHLVVPAVAVLSRQGRDLVFRIQDGRALWTYVAVGARSSESVEITDGLAEGDLVAVGGHFALAHEAAVEPRLVDGGRDAGH